ncbi:MAG: Cell division ATP-binding protein FtsE [Gammaproteobacteria bacterium]|nr:Cell division ATP-binding protein FtsE [Gammaproteobacteria bacterium]
MIAFNDVTKRYPGGHEALKHVSFKLPAGEMAFLTGHSGAGKSTLLKLIVVIERATQGQVVVNEQNLTRLPRRKLPRFRRQIGVVFQDHKLLPEQTVFENVALPLVVSGYSPKDTPRRVRAALDKVGLLGKEAMFPLMLSGGEQQRVGIARAVVTRPSILLADEPTGNVDAAMSDDIMDLFRLFNQVGTTVLVATHELRHIERLGKPVLCLDDGYLVDRPADQWID